MDTCEGLGHPDRIFFVCSETVTYPQPKETGVVTFAFGELTNICCTSSVLAEIPELEGPRSIRLASSRSSYCETC